MGRLGAMVVAVLVALGSSILGAPQQAQAAAPVIATTSTINAGAVNPVVSVTTSSSVFAPGVSVADFTITTGSTGLAGAPAFTRVSDTHVSFAFTGTAAAGEVSITAGAGAFNPDPGAGSNTVTITVPAAVNASSAPAAGSLAIVVDTRRTEDPTITLWGDLAGHSKDWGDGTANTEESHTYNARGLYTIEFPIPSGSLLIEYCYDSDSCLDGLVDVTQWGNSIVGPSAFEGAQNLTRFTATDAPAVADEASSMFKNATRFNGNINSWDVSGVQRMNSMFQGATAFNQPLNNWDTSNVTTMYEMFNNARAFNQDLNNWNTSSVVGNGVEGMFRGATAFNGNVTTWDTSSVTTMREMFADAKAFNQAIGVWNTANVTRMDGMFRSAEAFNQPLATNGSIWNTAKVTTMREMFNNARAFNQDLNTWVTSSVAGNGMEGMFRGATAFNGNVTTWDTSSVTTMREMFKQARAFNQPIGSWSTGNVQNMENMFELATVFNQPLNLWDTSRVANMKQLFRFAEAFNQPIGSWSTVSVLTMERMFNGAKAFNYPLETWTTIQVTNMHKMFEEATVFNQPLGLWDTSNVTNMEQMFWLARGYNQSLAGLEVTGLNQSLGLFMTLSGMTPLNVDATLVGWAAQGLPTRSIALNLGNNGGSPGNLDNNFYTEGSGSVAVDALRAKGWTVSNGNFISTAHSLPTPTTDTMNAGDSATFSVLLKASGGHSYTYDSRSVLSATPTLAGASAGAVTYDSAANDGTYTFQYTAPSNVGGAAVSAASAVVDDIVLTVNGQTIVTPIKVTINPVAPSAPTITSATPGNGSAVVAFTAPTSNGGSAITDYEYRLDGGAWVSVGSTSSPFTITGLTNGTAYQVELRAVNGVGPGPVSAPVTVTPAVPPVFPPSAPVGVVGVPGDREVAVSWQPPVSVGSFPVTDYLVTAGPGGQTCLAKAPALTCTVTGLANGTAYTFVVTALNGAGWGAGSQASGPVTPSAQAVRSLTLFQGTRAADGRHDRITTGGTSVGVPAGSRLTPWIRYGATGEFKEGVASIVVDDKGGFTWTRQIRKDKAFHAYVAFEDLESNRVIWQRVR